MQDKLLTIAIMSAFSVPAFVMVRNDIKKRNQPGQCDLDRLAKAKAKRARKLNKLAKEN